MSDLLIKLGTKGCDTLLSLTRAALEKKAKDAPIAFPETNYHLPFINALFNMEPKTAGDCLAVLAQAEGLSRNIPCIDGFAIPALGGVLNKGCAALACEEILAALNTTDGVHPLNGVGFLPDKLLRSLGLLLVDGRIAGVAVILGPAKDPESAERLVRDFQTRSIVCLLAGSAPARPGVSANAGGSAPARPGVSANAGGSAHGTTFRSQLENRGVEIGLDNYIVPLGDDYLSAIYAVDWAVRAPLIYGGFRPGQWQGIAEYMRTRVPAFVVLLSHVDEVIVATGLGVLAFGVPIITDLDVPQLGKIDTTAYEALVTEKDYAKIASKCLLTRGIKVKVAQVNIPVAYAAAFEGERVRKEQLHAEFGGKAGVSFEYLYQKPMDEVDDGSVELIGKDIDSLQSMPLAIVVEVAGRKMQKDFEPILERQIHRFVNYCQGVMHIGQRDMNWVRVSREAYAKGFRLKHIGIVLHAMLHQEYSAIVDKVQVKIYTRNPEVETLLAVARKSYDERDERLSGMTDESVDTFYSCTLCQSFAPNHVCIISPERLGLCGAYSWLDGKASHEINPSGPNQPIPKGVLLDQRLGQWQKINDYVYETSNKTIEQVSMYSLLEAPQSSCGCFECIAAVIPEVNGIMVVSRDYSGMTPVGMTFTTLAGSVGGGVQTPGFLGIGRLYVVSKKFISAEGGLARLVWIPKELKEALGERLRRRCEEIGMPGLLDKIADETVATTAEELQQYLEKVQHPVLTLPPLM